MSGGHWDYQQKVIKNVMENIRDDSYEGTKQLLNQMPKLHKISQEIGNWLYDYIHDLDWHISGDTEIKNCKKYEIKMLKQLEKIVSNIPKDKCNMTTIGEDDKFNLIWKCSNCKKNIIDYSDFDDFTNCPNCNAKKIKWINDLYE